MGRINKSKRGRPPNTGKYQQLYGMGVYAYRKVQRAILSKAKAQFKARQPKINKKRLVFTVPESLFYRFHEFKGIALKNSTFLEQLLNAYQSRGKYEL